MNFLQHVINGLVIGHGYALIAIGWTVLLGVARLVNFGHGQMYMLGAFVTWFSMSSLGLSYWVALPIAVLVGALVGFIMQRIMLNLTIRQDLVSVMIATLGFGYILEGVAALTFGSTGQILDTPLSLRDVYWGDLWFTWQDIAVVLVTIAFFIALKLVVEHSSVGRRVRMVAEDPKLALLAGVNVKWVYLGVFCFEGAAVALAAGMVAPRTPILTSMGFDEVIITFVVVVLGGIGSVTGSYLAGLGIGIFTAFFGAYVSAAYSTAAMFVLLIALLVLRPNGMTQSMARH
ncbi:branched-chain amino acid ABC transporter permease [Vreelandella glaciei]|uniref:branched-chain amino acid ABC transporter permease n=1 Tax=Vreelandella glaciei TaxID=186761 RepID=UPI003002E331